MKNTIGNQSPVGRLSGRTSPMGRLSGRTSLVGCLGGRTDHMDTEYQGTNSASWCRPRIPLDFSSAPPFQSFFRPSPLLCDIHRSHGTTFCLGPPESTLIWDPGGNFDYPTWPPFQPLQSSFSPAEVCQQAPFFSPLKTLPLGANLLLSHCPVQPCLSGHLHSSVIPLNSTNTLYQRPYSYHTWLGLSKTQT